MPWTLAMPFRLPCSSVRTGPCIKSRSRSARRKNMRNNDTLLIAIALGLTVAASQMQAETISFLRPTGPTRANVFDRLNAVAADGSGAYVVVGRQLRKYSPSGNESWAREIDSEPEVTLQA